MEPESIITCSSNHIMISNLQVQTEVPPVSQEKKKKVHKRKSSCGSETNPIDLTEDEITPSKGKKKKKSTIVKDEQTDSVTVKLTKKELAALKGILKSCSKFSEDNDQTTPLTDDPTNVLGLGPSLLKIENTLQMIETRLCKIENTLEEMQKREKEAQCRVQKLENSHNKVKMVFTLEPETQSKQPNKFGEKAEVGAQVSRRSQLNTFIRETNTKEVSQRSQSSLSEQNVLDQNVLDQNVLDQNVLDQNVLDQNVIDHSMIDHSVTDHSMIDQNVIDHNPQSSVVNGEYGSSTLRTYPGPKEQPEKILSGRSVLDIYAENPTTPSGLNNSSNNNHCHIEETFPGGNNQGSDVTNPRTQTPESNRLSDQISNISIKEELLELLPKLPSIKQEVDFMKDDDGRILLFVCSAVRKLNSVQHMAVAGTFMADDWTHEYPFVYSNKSAQDLKKMAEMKAITFGLEVIKSLFDSPDKLCVMVVSSCGQLVQLMRKRNDFYPFLNLCDCKPLQCEHVPNKRWDTKVEFAATFPEDMPNLILALKGLQVHWCKLENSSETEQGIMQKYRTHVEKTLAEEVKRTK